MGQNQSNTLSREIAKLLHGTYIDETDDDQDRDQRERNQEKINDYFDEMRDK